MITSQIRFQGDHLYIGKKRLTKGSYPQLISIHSKHLSLQEKKYEIVGWVNWHSKQICGGYEEDGHLHGLATRAGKLYRFKAFHDQETLIQYMKNTRQVFL